MQRHRRGLGGMAATIPHTARDVLIHLPDTSPPAARQRFMQRRQLGLKHTFRVCELQHATHHEIAVGRRTRAPGDTLTKRCQREADLSYRFGTEITPRDEFDVCSWSPDGGGAA